MNKILFDIGSIAMKSIVAAFVLFVPLVFSYLSAKSMKARRLLDGVHFNICNSSF